MKNKKNYPSSLIFHLSSLRSGFTLIELMVVISMTAILGTLGIIGFAGYNQNQVLQSSANEVVSMLNLAKSRAQSQVKPTGCSGDLNGYRVVISAASGMYTLQASCVDTPSLTIDEQEQKLPPNINFDADSSFFFPIKKGGVEGGGQIVISNSDGKTRTIVVNSLGNVTLVSPTPTQ